MPRTIILGLLPVIGGVLVVQLLWREPGWKALALKLFLGVGVGLGLQSLVYFVYLLGFPGQTWFVYAELAAVAGLLVIVIVRDRQLWMRTWPVPRQRGGPATWILIVAAAIVATLSLLSTGNYLLRRRQGDWDAWMMYNRAARFIHLDQSHWLESFSPEMDPIFHADYPLLLAMNITVGWDVIGVEASSVPMLQSALFGLGCAGLLVAALARSRSVGQASLGLLVLWGIPTFVNEGARQTADVPLAFYVLATGVLLTMALREQDWRLLLLAGLTAGLGAWTKNEGSLLAIGALVAVVVTSSRKTLLSRTSALFGGMILPLAILGYFKVFLAPPGDMLAGGAARFSSHLLDASRHEEILGYFIQQLARFGAWNYVPLAIGILPILAMYALLFKDRLTAPERTGLIGATMIVGVQLAGDYAAFLMTPYPLAWHLSYSTTRLIVQVFPLLAFTALAASIPVERLLARTNSV